MPWGPNESTKFTKKANTPKKKRQFSEVANSVLAKTGDEGRAIREANAAVAGTVHHKKQTKHSLIETNQYNWRSRENLRQR
jgi:hypothetical protein